MNSTETHSPVDLPGRSIALTVLATAAGMALLYWAREVFIPVVLAVLISYALEPIVVFLGRIRLPRLAASALVMLAFTGLVGYGAYALSDDATAMVAEMPRAATRLRQVLRAERGEPGAIQQVQQAAEELQRTADEAAGRNPVSRGVQRVQIEEPAINVREYLTWGSAGAIAFAAQSILVLFFVFFLLASGDLFKRKLVKIAGSSLEKKKITVQILNEIDTQIARYLLVLLGAGTLVGVATWLAFRAVGLEHAGIWGIAAGLCNAVPYLGPIVVMGGSFIAAFLQFGELPMALWVGGISLVITNLEGWLLMPWLASRSAKTNQVAVFVALIFWSFVWGLWGTLLAVPMLVVVKAISDRIDDLKPVSELLGD